jgi:mitochondrial cardiolipin hydrolase
MGNDTLHPPYHSKDMEKAYFSPGEDCLNAIVDCILSAATTLKICVFTISDDRIVKAIIDRYFHGVKIRIITDNDKCRDYGSDIRRLCDIGLEIRTDRTPYHMHHKFAIIDDQLLLTGSYNWTRSAADNNHENIITTAHKEIVNGFLHEFELLWEEMAPYY